MANIDSGLMEAIRKKSGLARAQIYQRIKQTASAQLLPRHLAAIKFAADLGVTINRYASADELFELRQAGAPVTPPIPVALPGSPQKQAAGRTKKIPPKKIPNQVFVVHGRDVAARKAVFDFLRAVNVKPIEWINAIRMTKKPSPYIGEILHAAFSNARAVVVLLTPDDLAVLRPDLQSSQDPSIEKRQAGQARPNVLFECGMAFSSHPDRTVLVQLGSIRPFSDTAGRHVLHLSDSIEKRAEFAIKLQNAGCDVDQSGTDWMSAGDFSDPETRIPRPGRLVKSHGAAKSK